MQKWEYGILDCKLDNGSHWRPWKFCGTDIYGWQSVVFSSYVNQLGDQGWELVGFSHSMDNNEYWVFKRPKE
jgi:hypothetical protein